MTTSLETLVASGTKLWLDSVDPEFIMKNRNFGATGATSNPIIIADLIKSGRFDRELTALAANGLERDAIAWRMTDTLVKQAQDVFLPVFESSQGNDGYVSFELDPLLEDEGCSLTLDQRISRYVELGRHWSKGQPNRMIKVPATPAGLGALEDLVAAGVTVNVTLIFSDRQYRDARDAAWRGARRRKNTRDFKSVYSIFVSRIDVYTQKHVSDLSPEAQGQVGIVNAKRIWKENKEFWSLQDFPLDQEIIFASTGTKDPADPVDKYVEALAGSDIQTNPPSTNDAIQQLSGKVYSKNVDHMPPKAVLDEIDEKVDFEKMERVLMEEGLRKFADPQKALLELIEERRRILG